MELIKSMSSKDLEALGRETGMLESKGGKIVDLCSEL